MAQFKVNSPCRWEMLLISWWIQVSFVPVIQSKHGPVPQLSSQDILLLKDEQDPKCFTRAGRDFTCFFETVDNSTYDLIYKVDGGNRCDMRVQRTEEGTFLHICSFPSADVYLYVEMHLDVVELNTNTSLYSRTLCVEDHFLLDPPDNVALHQTGRAGQLLVSWHTKVPTYCGDTVYRIQYSSKGVGERTKETKKDKNDREILNWLEPGEETDVQVTIKCVSSPNSGHWSSWTDPVKAMVPQVAGDISLICYTSDLRNITCQWNGSRYEVEQDYKLYYKIGLRSEQWSECLVDGEVTDLCCFHGDESSVIKVKLSSSLDLLSRTFYTEEFTIHTAIKTPPPGHLRAALDKGKLCLNWEAPLPSLSAHLQYEVGYRTREEQTWVLVSLQEAGTGTCLEVSAGSQYNVKIRAKPNGAVYSGYWSDWSHVLSGHISTDTGMLLMLCIPVSVLLTTVLLISTYLSKLKQYFWPPVPNLDKVLQGFLTQLDRERWDPPLTVKQWPEETTASVVEIISEDGVSGLREDHAQLASPEGALSIAEQVEGNPGTKVFPEYVTLNKDSAIVCPNRNPYEQVGEHLQSCQCSCTDGIPPRSGNFYNYSYMSLAERFDCKVTPAGEPGNLYTNLPCS